MSGREQARVALVQLGAKVDSLVSGVMARQGQHMRCGRGCHACCQPGLTVGPAEAARLRELLTESSRAETLRRLAREQVWQGTRCELLDEAGACSVYEARPLVCRAHGVPQQVWDEVGIRRDVCELNFQGSDLATLEPRDVLDLDSLHTVLAVIHARFDSENHEERTALTAAALLGDGLT